MFGVLLLWHCVGVAENELSCMGAVYEVSCMECCACGAVCGADVTEPLLVEVDQIYHLACPASPVFYKHNPVKVLYCIVLHATPCRSIGLSLSQ